MDLRQLQALVAIADHGSFSAAANALHTVQSNVSSHIAHLEKDLGVQLVDRTTGQLTEEGQAVSERARRIASELEAVVADVAALRDEIVGTVRLGMIGTTARWVTPLLLERMAATHPKVRLVISEGTSSILEPQLASGAVDLALVNLPLTQPDLSHMPLFDEDLVLVVPPGHPLAAASEVSFAALEGVPLLLPAAGTAFRQEIDAAAGAAGVKLTSRAELDGLRLMASLAVRGFAPAILPATGLAGYGSGYASVAVRDLPRRRVGIAHRRRGRPSAPVRATIETLQAVTEAHLDHQYGLHWP